MIDYMVIEADDIDTLVELIGSYLHKGYKPQGGISVCSYMWTDSRDDSGYVRFLYNQAMVKEN